MDLSKHRSRLRVLVVGGMLAALLAIPVGVNADTTEAAPIPPAASRGATISVDSTAKVTGKLVATVDVTFTCDPFLVYDWETGMQVPSTDGRLEEGSVTVLQVSGKTILSSRAFFGGGSVVCDGTTATHVSVPVTASTAPWKNGAAVTGATVYIADAQFESSHYASSGPVSIKLSAK